MDKKHMRDEINRREDAYDRAVFQSASKKQQGLWLKGIDDKIAALKEKLRHTTFKHTITALQKGIEELEERRDGLTREDD